MRARAATWVLLCARVVCTMPRGVHKRSELRNVCHSRRWSRVRRKKNSAVPGFRHTFGAATAASEARGSEQELGMARQSHPSQPWPQRPQPQPAKGTATATATPRSLQARRELRPCGEHLHVPCCAQKVAQNGLFKTIRFYW